mmetsp:Transcript_24020/g.33589  ORF Transcript_24020/g.33589 Transcript_24020/m.33589 type:complete len:171 (+) Transcript_24020:31-543(+)|eukprot:CAMPEP_0185251490 /NCGR_PEP_ID=MMETSP1359-20130426/878_1 /TAXON_ID=552665 /ORGANISM="Bigelowiella longifila, Strain CCMP242" /LENGTH=170 /DNA_ID=CAMNT_0027833405 /DNA_START=188 /DNA_END=700 /DNA_ORIENTATION=-
MSAPSSTSTAKLEIKGEEQSKPKVSTGESGVSKKDAIRMAQCCCGNMKLTCLGDPIRVSVCHCYECQRRTGSAFGAQARYSYSKVKIEEKVSSTVYSRKGDENAGKIHFHFCPNCGSTVYYRFDGMDDMLIVTLGSFADKDFPEPTLSVYEDRAHSWSQMTHSTCTQHWA